MNENLQISDADILKIGVMEPIVFSDFINDIEYEWFYLEIVKDEFQIVCVFSIKDPFQDNKINNNKSSVYLTWFQDNSLVAYSYSFFNSDVEDFFYKSLSNWIKNKTNDLELWIPDYTLSSYIHLVLESPINSCNKIDVSNSNKFNDKKHYWQFLKFNNDCKGYIEKIHISKDFRLNEYVNRSSRFYDELLRLKLKNKLSTKKILNGAQIYIDHNAGIEPLYRMKKNWFWWHAGNSSNYEVCYYFPHCKSMYYISGDLNSSKSEILSFDNNLIIQKKSMTFFGLFYPKKLKSPKFNIINYKIFLESAPFYMRCKSLENNGSTLEVMNPQRILKKFNQFLMFSRKIYIKKNIKNIADISGKFSFNEICSIVTKLNGKSFYASSFILNKFERINSYFIYTICRLIDDATDEIKLFNLNKQNGVMFSKKLLSVLWDNDFIPLSLSLEFLNSLRFNFLYCTNYVIDNQSLINFIIKSRDTIKSLNIEKKYFEELIAGQNMDENFSQPKNLNDLNIYCFRVAGVVGILMAKIFKTPTTGNAYIAAEKLGIAMQITNILRDIKEDFEKNRIYIPISLLDKFGVNDSHLNLKFDVSTVNENFLNVIDDLAQYAISCYKTAYDGIKFIPDFRSRLCVKLMIAIYGSILGKILINKMIVFKKRVIVSKFNKIIICLKVILGFHPLRVANLNGEKNLYEKI